VYRIELGERVSESLRRIIVEEFARALEWLASADRPFDLRIHETRQCMKRVRSLTDLGRAALPTDTRAVLYRAARDAARVLAETRERAALVVAFDELLKQGAGLLTPGDSELVRAALGGTLGAPAEAEPRVAAAREIIDRARTQAERLDATGEGWAALDQGFRSTYRSARRALAQAYRRRDAELLHEFRTPAKRHLHHVRLLELAWPGPLAVVRQELSRLGELLGDHHDLHLLAAELRLRPELDTQVAMLMPQVRERLSDLEHEAMLLGLRLFAEKPKAASRRFGVYFEAWHG
jgi:hypothetical protein